MIEVVAGIIIHEGKVLIARRAKHKSMPGKWEFPGGKIEANESPETALERELFEEFGVKTKTEKYVTTILHNYGTFQIKLQAYYSSVIQGNFELTDHDQITWVSIDDIHTYDFAAADIPICHYISI